MSCFPCLSQKQPTTIDFFEIPIIVTFSVSLHRKELYQAKSLREAKGNLQIFRSSSRRASQLRLLLFVPSYQLSRQLLHLLQCRKVLLRIFISKFSDCLFHYKNVESTFYPVWSTAEKPPQWNKLGTIYYTTVFVAPFVATSNPLNYYLPANQ